MCLVDSKVKSKKASELEMLHYIFIHSYLIFVDLVDVSFSHGNSGKQTLLKSDWVIGNNIVMTFALFNQSEEYRSIRKKGRARNQKCCHRSES